MPEKKRSSARIIYQGRRPTGRFLDTGADLRAEADLECAEAAVVDFDFIFSV